MPDIYMKNARVLGFLSRSFSVLERTMHCVLHEVLHDDTNKLQKAMDERKKQFIREIPKGYVPGKNLDDQCRSQLP